MDLNVALEYLSGDKMAGVRFSSTVQRPRTFAPFSVAHHPCIEKKPCLVIVGVRQVDIHDLAV